MIKYIYFIVNNYANTRSNMNVMQMLFNSQEKHSQSLKIRQNHATHQFAYSHDCPT